MADESENLTIQILRQIQANLSEVQAKLGEHDHRFEQLQDQMDRRFERMQEQLDYRFDGVERKLAEVIDGTTKALGAASIANVRHDSVSQHFAELELELRDLRARLRRLEERV